MSDKPLPPVPAKTIILTAEGRKQIGSVPPNPSGVAPTAPQTLPPTSAPSSHATGSVLIITAARPNTPASQATPATEQSGQRGPMQRSPTASGTSTSGRPLDVNGDVQQTSALSGSGILHATQNTDGAAFAVSAPSGRQMDVQVAPAQPAIIVERNARTTKQPRRSKHRKKADLDEERGRFRHTIRLDPKVEQKLRMVAEILGIDLNAAIAVCISVHHHRLTKPSGGGP